jgi:hypothetical protein
MKISIYILFLLAGLDIHSRTSQRSNQILVASGTCGNVFWDNNGTYYSHWHALRDALKERGYLLEQISDNSIASQKDFKVIISNCTTVKSSHPPRKLLLILWEPPSVFPSSYSNKHQKPFSKILTWNDDLVDNKRYFKFYYPEYKKMIEDIVDFDEKKLCFLMARNRNSSHPNELYSERRKVIEFFERKMNGTFDLYGSGWSQCRNYKGPVEDKINCIKHYRFCYCYENMKSISGYITEKIFHCFQAGCVPIYWGAKNVKLYIPKNCFIAREDFANDEQLYAFISTMPRQQYEGYINNIRNYLENDPRAQLFSLDNFAKILMDVVL